MILMFVCGAKSTKKAQEQVEGKAETRDGRGFEYFVSLSVARSSRVRSEMVKFKSS